MQHVTCARYIPHAGDVLIFAGDAGLEDSHDIERFEAWLQAQPHAHRLVIFGNMDSAAGELVVRMGCLLTAVAIEYAKPPVTCTGQK